ncbi:helix-turn-helix domain-containing protein [Micrococcus luteus]|uniref:helix-turn-helix domain-containing protein n=1 Tax=Micrococcus luteus TaxID=1270 RepID=UPI0010ADD8F9|nr:helix-turn-helix domain-containing protein [Micrococcus luteus]MBN6750220.1 helix-turn-helix transcriptional regulator [Micrococcus luteus]MBN6761129.1 helix-turn-helix transcriptional regulator [Micrococcus luteus]MBN6801799.1 helix-turn-helix transcriptional regulator [Micrococcus luteus]TKD49232.1 helix-turn-helix transcriptional regulator [Micrococcus luteus]
MTEHAAPPPDPGEFLNEVRHATPGWSAPYGGPEGIERLTVQLQDTLKQQSRDVAAVRVAAIQHMLTTQSASEVARRLGISRQALSKIAGSPAWSTPTW